MNTIQIKENNTKYETKKTYPVKEFLKKHSKLLNANEERANKMLEYRDIIFDRITKEIRKYTECHILGQVFEDG